MENQDRNSFTIDDSRRPKGKLSTVLWWILTVVSLCGAIAEFPSLASVLLLVFAGIALPVKQLQKFWKSHKMSGKPKGILLIILFAAGIALAPPPEINISIQQGVIAPIEMPHTQTVAFDYTPTNTSIENINCKVADASIASAKVISAGDGQIVCEITPLKAGDTVLICGIGESNSPELPITISTKEMEAAEKAEQERLAAEKAAAEKAEQERLAAEKAAAEKAEQERLAAEKAAAEKAEQERLAAEKAAAERAEQERLAAEKAAAEKAEQERLAAAQAAAQQQDYTKSGAGLVGSVESDKYHDPGCRWAKKIKPENEIWFSSAEDARAQGYIACKVCH